MSTSCLWWGETSRRRKTPATASSLILGTYSAHRWTQMFSSTPQGYSIRHIVRDHSPPHWEPAHLREIHRVPFACIPIEDPWGLPAAFAACLAHPVILQRDAVHHGDVATRRLLQSLFAVPLCDRSQGTGHSLRGIQVYERGQDHHFLPNHKGIGSRWDLGKLPLLKLQVENGRQDWSAGDRKTRAFQ